MNKIIFKSGQKIGKWTIINENGNTNEGKLLYKCQCECGKINNVIASNLKQKRSLSCLYCSRRRKPKFFKKLKDLTLKQQIKIKELYEGNFSSEELSIKYQISIYNILICVRKHNGIIRPAIRRYIKNPNDIAKKRKYNAYKGAAKYRNIKFNLSKKQFYNLVEKNCYYCDSKPNNITKCARGGIFIYNGIDRKNSNSGYNINNTIPCCKICNRAKSNMSYIEFLAWIQKISQNQQFRI